MKKFVRTVSVAAAFAVLLCGMIAARAAGVTAPRFDLRGLDGSRYTESNLIGRPTLMVFWASWCPVCQVELPKLHEMYKAMEGRGLRVLAVAFSDDEPSIRRYVNNHSQLFDFPVLYDAKDRTAKRFGVFGTPTIYLINGRGEIEYVTWLVEDPALKRKLEALLGDHAVQTSDYQS
jgi:peroxiredoxin